MTAPCAERKISRNALDRCNHSRAGFDFTAYNRLPEPAGVFDFTGFKRNSRTSHGMSAVANVAYELGIALALGRPAIIDRV